MTLLGKPRHTGKTATFLIGSTADLDGSGWLSVGTSERFDGVHGCCEVGLHVGTAAAVEATVSDQA